MGTDVAEVPALEGEALDGLIATAARAPSVHNNQPWRLGVAGGD